MIERERYIEAAPNVVYAFLTDPTKNGRVPTPWTEEEAGLPAVVGDIHNVVTPGRYVM
jgi:hypothetical protein